MTQTLKGDVCKIHNEQSGNVQVTFEEKPQMKIISFS